MAKPLMITWTAEFELWAAQSLRLVATAKAHISQGIEGIRTALNLTDPATEPAKKLQETLNKLEKLLGKPSEKVEKRYLEFHRARIRFEYQIPIAIALAVLCLTVLRLVVLASS